MLMRIQKKTIGVMASSLMTLLVLLDSAIAVAENRSIPDAPLITLNAPANGAATTNKYMHLNATVSTTNPTKVWFYGGVTATPANLLFVRENVTGSQTFDYNWNMESFDPEPGRTMGLWHFDDGTGSAVSDSSGNANNGTFVGSPVWSTDGRFGYALSFGGANDYVSIPDAPSLDIDSATGAITIEAWIYPHTSGGSRWRSIIAKRAVGSAPATNYEISLDQTTGNLLFYSGHWPQIWISSVSIPLNQWSYVAVTLQASEGRLRFYRNGVLLDSTTTYMGNGGCFGATNTATLTIGTAGSLTECFDGLIDDSRLTNRALSAEEIAANYGGLTAYKCYWRVVADDGTSPRSESEVRSFYVTTLPVVTLVAPNDGATTSNTYMTLSATVADQSNTRVWVYGDTSSNPTELLYVRDSLTGIQNVDYLWNASRLTRQSPNTMGLWHFDEGTGTALTDSSGNGNNGTFSGSPAWSTAGKFGYALSFNGTSDYVSIPDAPSLDIDSATGAITMEAWIYPHTSGGNLWRSIISKKAINGGPGVNYQISLDRTTGNLLFYSGHWPQIWISSVSIPLNQWSYVAVTLQASERRLRFYRNGVLLDSTAAYSGNGGCFGAANNTVLTFGISGITAECFDGLIDEARLTRRALSSAEIAANFKLGNGIYRWKVTATDEFLNSSTAGPRQFTILPGDTTPPTLTVVSPPSGGSYKVLPTLNIQFHDDQGLNRGYYQIDGCAGVWSELWSFNSGAKDTTMAWTVPSASPGPHSIYIKVVDDWGNTSVNSCSAGWNFTYTPAIVALHPVSQTVYVTTAWTEWVHLNEQIGDMKAASLKILYDGNLVSPTSIVDGSELPPQHIVNFQIHPDGDSILIDLAILEGTFSGPGDLVGINFVGVAATASTPLILTRSILRDLNNQDIPHNTENAQVQILPDNVRPTFSVVSPPSGGTYKVLPALSIQFHDNIGLNRAYYQVDGCAGTWVELWSYNSGGKDTTIAWTVPPIPPGLHSIHFKIVDDDGNVSNDTCSAAWNFAYDIAPPTLTVVSPASGGLYDQLPTLDLRVTDDLNLDRAYWQLDGCSGPWLPIWSNNSGSFDTTLTWSVPNSPQGTHTIYFKAVDDAGNSSVDTCTYSWSFSYDLVGPTSEVLSPPSGGVYGSLPTLQIHFKDNFGLSLGYYQIDSCGGDGWLPLWTHDCTVSDTTISIQVPPMSEGNHTVHFKILDDLNTANADTCTYSWSFIYDLSGPIVQVVSPPPNGLYNYMPWIKVRFRDLGGLDMGQYSVDNCAGPWQPLWSDNSGADDTTVQFLLPAGSEGTHHLYFRATDDIGHVNPDSCAFSWVYRFDVTPPTLRVVYPPSGQTFGSLPTLVINAKDNVGIDALVYQLDECTGAWPGIWSDSSGATEATVHWTVPAVPPGQHYVYLLAIDDAGNFSGSGCDFVWSFNLIEGCCVGVTGNVNGLGMVDLSDLSALVNYLTGGGFAPPCPSEANVNNTGLVDLSDLSSLVNYLTGGGFQLPNCP